MDIMVAMLKAEDAVTDLESSDLEANRTVNSEPQSEATQERKDMP